MAERPSSGARAALASYFKRWTRLPRPARLYLLHAALLTGSLAITGLFFNLAILALGYSLAFLGLLNTISIAVAAILSLPLWWLATQIGLRRALAASVALQALSVALFALWPAAAPLVVSVGLGGAAAVLFQVSAPPFMMRHSADESRDHLFSANTAIAIGFAGVGSLAAGGLPALFGRMLGAAPDGGLAYRATFGVAALGVLLSLAPLLLIREPAPADPPPARDDAPRAAPSGARRAARLIARLRDRIPEAWRGLLRRPRLLLALLIPPFLISWGAALLIPYLNLFFKQRFAISDAALGLIFAGLNVSTGLAALVGPLISARVGKIRAITLTQAISIPFLIALGVAPALGLAVGAALARQALFNLGAPLYAAFAMERADEEARPTLIGLINGAYSAGYLAAPAISTFVQARYGFAPLFAATTACYTLAVLASYWFFVRNHPPSGA